MPTLLLRNWLPSFLFMKPVSKILKMKLRPMQKINSILIFLLLTAFTCSTSTFSEGGADPKPKVIGTYGSPPHTKGGTILYDSLISQLKDLHCNTYNWLIMPDTNSFKQFKEFLPLAKKDGIDVWATLIPPTELEGKAEQYATNDMRTRAADLAQLSLTNPNFKAWSIDDFVHNLKTYTPQYVKEFEDAAKKINPAFKFYPVCYYKFINQKFADDYRKVIDGIVFPYRNESSSKADLNNYSHIGNEIKTLKEYFGNSFPIFVDVYSSPHSTLGDPSAEFISNVIQSGIQNADGVIIYRHPSPKYDTEKYKTVKAAIIKGAQ
jgi:hypothetical protein